MLKLFFETFLERGDAKQLIYQLCQSIERLKYLPNSILGESIKEIIGLHHLYRILSEDTSTEALRERLVDIFDSKKIAEYVRKIRSQELLPQEIDALKEEINQKWWTE
ncbi:MAG: hypothetical protein U5K69_28625 [Balneolaceae bacterium]|nr:hypothetical protein [Balneolaceae bacterium]